MAVQWEVRSEQAREQEALDKWGKDEWNRRKAVVKQKQNELDKEYGFEAGCIVGTQFEPIARAMSQELWDRFKNESVHKWYKLVLKITGVN